MNDTCRQVVGVRFGGLLDDSPQFCGRPATRYVMRDGTIWVGVCGRHAVHFVRRGFDVKKLLVAPSAWPTNG